MCCIHCPGLLLFVFHVTRLFILHDVQNVLYIILKNHQEPPYNDPAWARSSWKGISIMQQITQFVKIHTNKLRGQSC